MFWDKKAKRVFGKVDFWDDRGTDSTGTGSGNTGGSLSGGMGKDGGSLSGGDDRVSNHDSTSNTTTTTTKEEADIADAYAEATGPLGMLRTIFSAAKLGVQAIASLATMVGGGGFGFVVGGAGAIDAYNGIKDFDDNQKAKLVADIMKQTGYSKEDVEEGIERYVEAERLAAIGNGGVVDEEGNMTISAADEQIFQDKKANDIDQGGPKTDRSELNALFNNYISTPGNLTSEETASLESFTNMGSGSTDSTNSLLSGGSYAVNNDESQLFTEYVNNLIDGGLPAFENIVANMTEVTNTANMGSAAIQQDLLTGRDDYTKGVTEQNDLLKQTQDNTASEFAFNIGGVSYVLPTGGSMKLSDQITDNQEGIWDATKEYNTATDTLNTQTYDRDMTLHNAGTADQQWRNELATASNLEELIRGGNRNHELGLATNAISQQNADTNKDANDASGVDYINVASSLLGDNGLFGSSGDDKSVWDQMFG